MQKLFESAEGRSYRLWVIGALVVGLVVGLVLAWQVFPTRWVNTDPSDLRAEHQADYIAMVADSFAASGGDANAARERLYELVDEDTSWADVAALIDKTAADLAASGDDAAALRVRRMAELVPLPVDEPAEVAVPEGTVESVLAPAEASEPETEPVAEEGTGIGWLPIAGLIVVLAAVAGIVYVLLRDKKRTQGPDAGDLEVPFEPTLEDRRHGSAVSPRPIPTPGGFSEQVIVTDEPLAPNVDLQGEDDTEASETLLEEVLEEAEETPLAHTPLLEREEGWHIETAPVIASEPEEPAAPRPVELAALSDEDLEPAEEPPTDEILSMRNWPRRRPSAEPALAPGQLGVFETSYSYGDDDFYHAFTIESPAHEFLGQCGIVISDVLGTAENQLVDAFDIWLFETQGTRTLSKVLVSEYAAHDEAISAKLARKGEVVTARPGLVFELETESIRLTATLQDVAYREQTPEERSAFERLKIQMVVEQLS